MKKPTENSTPPKESLNSLDWQERLSQDLKKRMQGYGYTVLDTAPPTDTTELVINFPNQFQSSQNTGTKANSDSPLQALLALSLDERREAVVRDVRGRTAHFSTIPADDLAAALGVPQYRRPGDEWSFIRYAPIVSVEEHARECGPASEFVYLIQDAVSAERFQQLLKHSEPLDDADDPSFAFLTKGERSRLEEVIAENQLKANESNGMNCIAQCSVECESGAILEFEADIEDDGEGSNLRTPYDKCANRFTDLSRCLTSY